MEHGRTLLHQRHAVKDYFPVIGESAASIQPPHSQNCDWPLLPGWRKGAAAIKKALRSCKKSAIAAATLLFGAGLFATGALGQAAPKERSAISKECLVKADAQNLHGKERKVFRVKCKRDAAAAAKKS